jgi:5'-nucleotidase
MKNIKDILYSMKQGELSKVHILVTNDDGVFAPGLLALARSMSDLGKVSILAPDRNWSAKGHVKTLDRPLRVSQVELADGTPAWASDGAPSDCVALGFHGFFEEKIDLVVSGINPTANVGHDLTYSGTVTAAMEASIWGLPAVAVSLDTPESHAGEIHFDTAAYFAKNLVSTVLENHRNEHILLNVNVPYLPFSQIKGLKITRQGLRIYHDRLEKRLDPRGVPYYWNTGEFPTGVPEDGTDIGALAAGFVSVTPIQLDLTAYQQMQSLESWQWENNPHEAAFEPAQLFLHGIYY